MQVRCFYCCPAGIQPGPGWLIGRIPGVPGQHPARPRPAAMSEASGACPAQAGCQAGWPSSACFLLARPLTMSLREARSPRSRARWLAGRPGMLPGPCRVAGRMARVAGRHDGQSRPAARPAQPAQGTLFSFSSKRLFFGRPI